MLLSMALAFAQANDTVSIAAAALDRVCRPWLEQEAAKAEAIAAAQALGLRLLSRPEADFTLLMTGDVAVVMSGADAERDCSVSVENVTLPALTEPIQATADRLGWPEAYNGAGSHSWLSPHYLVAVIDETYDNPNKQMAIRFRRRGLPPPVTGAPADPLGQMARHCILYARGTIAAADLADLAIALGLTDVAAADGLRHLTGYGLEVAFGGDGPARRCALLPPRSEAGTLARRAAEFAGQGYTIRVERFRPAGGAPQPGLRIGP